MVKIFLTPSFFFIAVAIALETNDHADDTTGLRLAEDLPSVEDLPSAEELRFWGKWRFRCPDGKTFYSYRGHNYVIATAKKNCYGCWDIKDLGCSAPSGINWSISLHFHVRKMIKN